MQLRVELLAPVVLGKSGYSTSWCAVPSLLSVQTLAYCPLPRVNKPLDNFWFLQEASQDQSSSEVADGMEELCDQRGCVCRTRHSWDLAS